MIVGFDVYPDKRGLSIGVLVASVDRNLCRYFSAAAYHNTSEELSENLSVNLCSE
jgi:hypothetical protein